MLQKIDTRDVSELLRAMASADMVLSKNYISQLNSANIVLQKPNEMSIDELNRTTRFFELTQIVLDRDENTREKLSSVFNALGSMGASVVMVVNSNGDKTSITFGVRAAKELSTCAQILEKSLNGNFAGTKLTPLRKERLENMVKSAFSTSPYVASVTDVPGVRNEKEQTLVQGIEKLADAMRGECYTMILIADPVLPLDMQHSKRELENLYSSLVPFGESSYTLGANESDALSQSLSTGVTQSINKSLTNTVSHTVGKTTSTSNSKNGLSGAAVGASIGVLAGSVVPVVGSVVGGAVGGLLGGALFGGTGGSSTSQSSSTSDTNGTSSTFGASSGKTTTNTNGTTYTTGSSKSLQVKFENHGVKRLLEKIDKTLERHDACFDGGAWNCAAYFVSSSKHVSQMAASVYHSIIRGKNSGVESGAVTLFDADKSKLIANSLKYFEHPLLDMGGLQVTPGTLVSSSELAISANLPNHALAGLPVLECAKFGRSVASFDESKSGEQIELGRIFHMHSEEQLKVNLDVQSLSSHVFVTGSTGSGKSNAVCQILGELNKTGVKFLVIEPAKGEYKHAFKDVAKVYGTNPELFEMLRINPFSFPQGVHVLEHTERLVEILNVCWEMSAAMPSLLKEAIERAYTDAGWELCGSTNSFGEVFPNFADVARNVKEIVDSSDYDSENKGAYKGALLTRLNSLTNGINGMVFSGDVEASTLFDENVVVDISRVGSSETRALIMGILVLKLQEHRLVSGLVNSSLRHVTVLEEAHNLLRANSLKAGTGELLAKSVEMISDAIAQMRTYGEGFVIADQAPSALDASVIRNTNTKIILRLPSGEDRALVGVATNLSEKQIAELAKLPRGVAAVYQNEWVEPVLCKLSKAEVGEGKFEFVPKRAEFKDLSKERARVASVLFGGVKNESYECDLKELGLSASTQVALRRLSSDGGEVRFRVVAPFVKEIFPSVYEAFRRAYERSGDPVEWSERTDEAFRASVGECEVSEQVARDVRQCIVTQRLFNELSNVGDFEKWCEKGVR